MTPRTDFDWSRVDWERIAKIALLPLVFIWWVLYHYMTWRLVRGLDPIRTAALIGWTVLLVTAGFWLIGRDGHWTSFWSIRAVGGWIGLTGVSTGIIAKLVMKGWKPGVSLATWLVAAVCLVLGGFLASAVNRVLFLARREHRDALIAEQELNWKGLAPDQRNRLAHDMWVGKFQGPLADVGWVLLVAVVLVVVGSEPLKEGHNTWVSTAPVASPAAEAEKARAEAAKAKAEAAKAKAEAAKARAAAGMRAAVAHPHKGRARLIVVILSLGWVVGALVVLPRTHGAYARRRAASTLLWPVRLRRDWMWVDRGSVLVSIGTATVTASLMVYLLR